MSDPLLARLKSFGFVEKLGETYIHKTIDQALECPQHPRYRASKSLRQADQYKDLSLIYPMLHRRRIKPFCFTMRIHSFIMLALFLINLPQKQITRGVV